MLLWFPHRQGKYAEADALYVRAIESREALNGPDDPDIATLLGNRAEVLENQVRPKSTLSGALPVGFTCVSGLYTLFEFDPLLFLVHGLLYSASSSGWPLAK